MAGDPIVQKLGEQSNVGLQSDPPADFGQVIFPNAPVFGVVATEVGEFATLLHEVEASQARQRW